MIFPKNKEMNVPATKNGPKGTSDFKVFLPKNISPMPIIAPLIKAKNKAAKILGQPSTNPIKKASLISPMPIHLPLEIKTMKRKNAAAPKADIRKSDIPGMSDFKKS